MSMAETSYLLLPMKIQALPLTVGKSMMGPEADFSQLPWNDGKRDINPGTAFLSANIVREPLATPNLYCPPGLHLHWLLPDLFGVEQPNPGGNKRYPAVPDRWLVIRHSEPLLTTAWIVDSGYLSKIRSQPTYNSDSAAVPMPFGTIGSKQQPYRFLGRTVPVKHWPLATMDEDTYWNDIFGDATDASLSSPLTSLGYGTPSFSSFLPNCRNVFGFCDSDWKEDRSQDIYYYVFGWYTQANRENDPLRQLLRQNQSLSLENQIELLEKQFHWRFTKPPVDSLPESLICFGRIDISASPAQPSEEHLTVALGNTGTEALSALSAQQIDPTHKSLVEEQLEAIMTARNLDHLPIDVKAAFHENRHYGGFRSVAAGTLWEVVPDLTRDQSSHTSTQDPAPNASSKPVELPQTTVELLNKLNLAQQAYDQAGAMLTSHRRQAFADWYKFMICCYPPLGGGENYPHISRVSDYLLQRDVPLCNDWSRYVGQYQFFPADEKTNSNALFRLKDNALATSLASQVVYYGNQVLEILATHNDRHKTAPWLLQTVPAPRYWQATDPVVLIAGLKGLSPSDPSANERAATGTPVSCLSTASIEPVTGDSWSKLFTPFMTELEAGVFKQVKPDQTSLPAGYNRCSKNAWNPFIMEWATEVLPVAMKQPGSTQYDPCCLQDRFDLPQLSAPSWNPDLRSDGSVLAQHYVTFQGSTYLTASASQAQLSALETYLQEQLGKPFKTILTHDQTDQKQELAHLIASRSGSGNKPVPDPVLSALKAYAFLLDTGVLSQSLGGFNDALLMRKNTMQLPVADPIGFESSAACTRAVAQVIGQNVRKAPEPLSDFLPIRSGNLRLVQLRLVDNFGQSLNLQSPLQQPVVSETLAPYSGAPTFAGLPPRITQPAQLRFRWWAATDQALEMNSLPASSPICGWLVANNLDGSILVYDAAGKALGQLNLNAQWQGIPGSTIANIGMIPNRHLQKTVLWLQRQGASFLRDFIATTDQALEHINPASYAHHKSVALLMGRPIAVARAELAFGLQGAPAIDQSWEAFRSDLNRDTRTTQQFNRVKYPIRLGNFEQFNDGLVGFWTENSSGALSSHVYLPEIDRDLADDASKLFVLGNSKTFTLWQALDDPPLNVTMLLDPRGVVHAASGILPVKSISVPAEQYAAALKTMDMYFLTAPILTPGTSDALADPISPHVPVPKVSGRHWSWIANYDVGSACEIKETGLGTTSTQARFQASQQLVEGWLKLNVQSTKKQTS